MVKLTVLVMQSDTIFNVTMTMQYCVQHNVQYARTQQKHLQWNENKHQKNLVNATKIFNVQAHNKNMYNEMRVRTKIT